MIKFRKMQCVLCAVICLLLAVQSPAAAAANGKQDRDTGEVITVGYVLYDNMIKKDPEGDFYGYGVSYLNELSRFTGWTYRFVEVGEDERVEKLADGEIDLVCSLHQDSPGKEQLLFSQDSSGLEYVMLFAKKENNEIFFNDYASMNGKKIGINRNTEMEQSLADYAKEHEIAYQSVYYDNSIEVQEALEQGEIDLMLASSLRKMDNTKYVGRANPVREYFATGLGNKKLMDQLNQADKQLKQENPFYIVGLYDQYYGLPYQQLTGMTREEYDFIQSGNTIRVVCDASSYPMEYREEETGEYKGIYADAMRLISEESGLKFEYIPLQDYKEALSMINQGAAQMIVASYGNEKMAAEYNIIFSQSYISGEYTLVANRKQEIPDRPIAALPESYKGIHSYFREKEPNWQIRTYQNVEECFQAVNKGEVDITAVNSVFLQTVYNLNNYENLKIVPNMTSTIPISVAVSGEDREVIRSILDKAIYRIPKEKFQKCITENAINISYTPNIRDTMRTFFPYMLALLLGVGLLTVLIISRREKHFRHMAMTDSVTGLWNGVRFYQEAKELLRRNRGRDYLLLTLDINKFKFINNDFGIQIGDKTLWILGQRVRQVFQGAGIYARNNADVFMVLLPEEKFAGTMLAPLKKDIYFDNNGKRQYYRIALKVGIRIIRPRESPEDITLYADQSTMARKTIKDSVNMDIAYYDEKMKESIAREIAIENKMDAALENREFQVYLQPKYSLLSEQITGAEALVRWVEDKEIVPPDQFIPLFEKNGFILKVDFYVYEEVLKWLAAWREQGGSLVCISVNVSRVHIGTPDFFPKLNHLVEQYQIPKEYVELELTETIIGGAHTIMREFILECKQQGYLVSIDDFGSGYSSLNLLKDLPVDILKIDKGFLDETEGSRRNSIIVQQVVEMAKKMEIKTVCEGVENQKQARFLKQIGCDMAQGYLFSRPVPVSEFEQMIGPNKNN